MPDPTVAVALVLLVALVEATPIVRVPVGLLLATALLASQAELLPIAVLGAVGVLAARLALALSARAGRDRLGASPSAIRQREALRAHLARSAAYSRTTFFLSAVPGVPAGFLFPLLGAMRAPLGPAIAGTLVGRIPILALTTALFTWLGRVVSENDEQAAVTLGMLAIFLLVLRTVTQIDWQHRAETGEWRMRPVADPFVAMTTRTEDGRTSGWSTGHPGGGSADGDADVIEGELLGEEVDEPGPAAELPSPDDDDKSSPRGS